MIKIEVRDAVAVQRQVTARNGKQYTFNEQHAYAFTADREGKPRPYPQEVILSLRDGQEPYPVGNYSLAPTSVWVDGFRHLALAPKLVPLK